MREQLKQYQKENNDSFYIISCDLDNFKHINDTWGHEEGDRALIMVADVLFKIGKMYDCSAFRIGGDEFIIITDKSDPGLDEKIIKVIKEELDRLVFRDDFDIKISLGSSLYDGTSSIEDILNKADKKMYEAKRKSKEL